MHFIFIYGTLKRGFPNHNQYMQNFEFIDCVLSLEAFPLIVGGKWYSPILIDEIGVGKYIKGELFKVDKAGLELLNEIEGVGIPNGYHPIVIMVIYKSSNR